MAPKPSGKRPPRWRDRGRSWNTPARSRTWGPRCGALVLAERARTELAAAGARPRRLVLSGVDALTPSERRIAAMAAEGMTNPQIAQTLFLSLRTIEMHLSNAYRKLGISSRADLGDVFAGGSGPEPRRHEAPG